MTPEEIQRTLQEGQSLHREGRLAAAEEAYGRVVEAVPGNPDLWHLYGVVAFQQNHAEAAIERYRRALALRANHLQAHNNLAIALKSLGRWDEAIASFRSALALKADYPEALGNLALIRIEQGQLTEGYSLAQRAATLAPDSARWPEAMGKVALLMNDFDAAAELTARAARLAPDDATIAFEQGVALEGCGDDEGALAALARAHRLDPTSEEFRWSEALLLPRIPRDDDEVARALKRFDEGLARVDEGLILDTDAGRAEAMDAASRVAPVGLHYLPGNHTARQSRYADIVAKCARTAVPDLPRPAVSTVSGRRMRIGFVSSHLREHVVTRYFADFIVKLDRASFEKLVWSTNATRDAVTDGIAAAVDGFTIGSNSTDETARDILAAGLDALIYLDVGLDPAMMTLASLRLAPIQIACYGHPVTTGLDSIDYFLGAEAMETPDSDRHYRERLVRLPGLGASIQSPPPIGDGQWLDALRSGDRPIVMCLQNLQKISPAFDRTLASLLAKSGARLVVLNRGNRLTQRFRDRFARALDAHGLAPESLHVEPSRDRASFLGGISRADLVVDTPHFSGGATSLDAFAAGTPVVAFEGSMARGRQTSAMLRMMEIPELIAGGDDDYVRIAVDLLGNRGKTEAIRDRIRTNAPRLFGDARTIAALEDFLLDRIRSSAA